MDAVNYREILSVNGQCPVSFDLPRESGYQVNGLLIAPKLKDGTLSFIRIGRDSQAIVKRCGEAWSEIEISNIFGRYSLRTFFSETVKAFHRDYPECVNALGITYTEHVLRSLQWDIVGNTLILGCPKLGWYLFTKEENAYRYLRSFCGSVTPGYAGGGINCTDALLHAFRAERYFIKDENHIVFAGYRREEHWYLYEVELSAMRVSAFYPIEGCSDVQYHSSADQYLVFRPSKKQEIRDIEEPHLIWNGRVSVCDNTGQLINVLDFGEQKHVGWLPSVTPYGEDGALHVWYTNDEPSFSELHVLNLKEKKLETVAFENFINVYPDAENGSLTVIQNNGEALQVFEADPSLRQITPIAEIRTTALRPHIRCIGKRENAVLLQIDRAVYAVSSGGIGCVAAGQAFADYEPLKASPPLFDMRFLMFGDFYNLFRLYVDRNTADVVFADPLHYADYLPAELFDADGMPDYARIGGWIRENGIPQRGYTAGEEIEATLKHGPSARLAIDYGLPPKENFWIGNVTGV